MTELERVRFVVSQYQSLQGLRMLPVGMLFIATYFPFTGWVPSIANRPESAWFGWVALAVAGLGFFTVPRYYRGKVGLVEQDRETETKAVLATMAVIGFVTFALVTAHFLEHNTDLPIMHRAIMGVAVFLGVWGLRGWSRERLYYPGLAIGFLLANLIPYLESVAPLDRATYFRLDCTIGTLIGIGLVLCGFLDHSLLLRHLPSAPGRTDEADVASLRITVQGGADDFTV